MALNEITQEFDEIAQKRIALQAELDSLNAQEKAAKTEKRASGIAQAQALIDHFDIAPDEVTFSAKRTLVPRFRDPETGETWHGYGKRPSAFKDKDIEGYRIKAPKTSKKSGTKKGQQAKSRTTQPVAEQAQTDNVTATATGISTTAASEVAPSTPITTAPESTTAVGEFSQRPVTTRAAC
ncbi:H-NS histone family protein [Ralstonia solanacearum]|uniref:H-NS histone family protein n=1 Tax=Ralstonia solanacearum TaxID=305 RepID=UPI0023053E3A|nr:H-NS histone family protein [Ralstonia solanacearum]MDB0564358.1 H-NS histone family protein [Ralstonia solanacearum]